MGGCALDLFQGEFDPDPPEKTITLKEAVPTFEEAEAEATRLNALKDPGSTRYFAAPVRFYPAGRDVQVRY